MLNKIYLNMNGKLICCVKGKIKIKEWGIRIYDFNKGEVFISNKNIEYFGYNKFHNAYEVFLEMEDRKVGTLELLITSTLEQEKIR